jgi:cell division protein FtsB
MLLLGLPTCVVLMTTFLVLFGDQGLLELSRTEEQLADIRMEIVQIESENRSLEIQIRRLRSSPVQVELLTADKLQKASEQTTVFRFND